MGPWDVYGINRALHEMLRASHMGFLAGRPIRLYVSQEDARDFPWDFPWGMTDLMGLSVGRIFVPIRLPMGRHLGLPIVCIVRPMGRLLGLVTSHRNNHRKAPGKAHGI